MERLLFIDIAKAICIILVVVGHYYPSFSPAWYIEGRNVIYSFHMPLFMFVSGYIYIATKNDKETYGEFILKKAKRLMVPYFTTSFIVISIKIATQNNMYVETPVTPISYLKVLWQPEAASYLWFIWALWWMFVLVKLCRKYSSLNLLFLISAVLLLLPLPMPKVFCLHSFKNMFFFFMLGIICFEHKIIYRYATLHYLFPTLFCFLLLQIGSNLIGGGNVVLQTFTACLGIMAMLQISGLLEKHVVAGRLKWLMCISASSYVIYLFHTTFEGFAKSTLLKFFPDLMDGNNNFLFCIGAFVVIACGVICPIFLHKYISKQSNVLRFLFGLK